MIEKVVENRGLVGRKIAEQTRVVPFAYAHRTPTGIRAHFYFEL